GWSTWRAWTTLESAPTWKAASTRSGRTTPTCRRGPIASSSRASALKKARSWWGATTFGGLPKRTRAEKPCDPPVRDPFRLRPRGGGRVPAEPKLCGAVAGLWGPLLGPRERIGWVQRPLYPPLAPRLAAELAPSGESLRGPLETVDSLDWPPELAFMREPLLTAARQTLELVEAFVEASQSVEGPIGLYRALRRFGRIQETLYPLAPVFDPVSRWFLEPERREDDALVAKLRAGALREDEAKVGVLHASNERSERGSFSLYVPEPSDTTSPMPLI